MTFKRKTRIRKTKFKLKVNKNGVLSAEKKVSTEIKTNPTHGLHKI
jgi:hypothetical protein